MINATTKQLSAAAAQTPSLGALRHHFPADERRVWVHHSCASPRRDSGPLDGEWCLPATLLDITLGGIQLVLGRRFEVGALLKVEIEGTTPGASRKLLARVIHVNVQADGSYVLGCTFAMELGEDESGLLQARRVKAAETDGRAWVRLPCNVPTSYHPVVAAVYEPWPAAVLDFSPGGMRLLASRPVEPRTLLRVELEAGDGQTSRKVLARVSHCSAQEGGKWILGCAFANELSDADVRALL